MGVKIRDLKHRIKFQQMGRVADGQGGWIESWTDFTPPQHSAPEVWAEVKPASAGERYFAQKIEMIVTHKICIRWLDGITQEMRIIFENRIFQIKGIRRENEERWFMLIDAKEGEAS